MEAEGDSGKFVEQQSQVLRGDEVVDSRGTKNPRDQVLRELRNVEEELKDEEGELMKERKQMESKDMPEHQRSDLSSDPDCSSIEQSRNLLDRMERNAQRQLAAADEIRRSSEHTRTVKARGEQKMGTAALGQHDDDGGAANGGKQKMETDALDGHDADGDAANGGEQKMETAGDAAHECDGGGDVEQMDWMEEQVPRTDSKLTSEAKILKPADHVPFNRGDDVVENMDRGKSPEQLANEANEMVAEQEKFDRHVDDWDAKWHSAGFGYFRDITTFTSMQYAHLIPGRTSRHTGRVHPSLQIFSIKLAAIDAGLEWPLPVYGVIVARDNVDHNRNILFSCYRSRSQILTEKDPFLALIGPSRAIVCEESVVFEIQLKVRGTTESKDRALITGVCTYNRGGSSVCFTNCFCTVELRLEVLEKTVQATVLGILVKDGSWPSGCGGRVACSVLDGEIDAPPGEVELLVSRRKTMPVTCDGYLRLSRNVVSVDVSRCLNLDLEVYSPSGDTIGQKKLSFEPKHCNISQVSCKLHDIELEITVVWSSLVSEKRDISAHGFGCDEEQMDWDIQDQVPRIDSKLTSEVEIEADTELGMGVDTNESVTESNTSIFVSDKSILKPEDHVPTNTGDDVVEKMDRGKSDKQLEIEAEKMDGLEKRFAMYVDAWEGTWSYGFGRFQDKTTVSSMQYTNVVPGSARCGRMTHSVQIFSVKLAEIQGGLEWPLPVYGMVAARDHVDHNRNLLFARNRSRCQILKEDDPFLTLTSPSRAIVGEESVVFEIQLKVRGRTKSQDRTLINDVRTFHGRYSPICFTNCFCTIELSLDALDRTVQATILGVRVKEGGSWPSGCGGRVACSVIEADARPEEVELLGSRYRPMPMTSEG